MSLLLCPTQDKYTAMRDHWGKQLMASAAEANSAQQQSSLSAREHDTAAMCAKNIKITHLSDAVSHTHRARMRP